MPPAERPIKIVDSNHCHAYSIGMLLERHRTADLGLPALVQAVAEVLAATGQAAADDRVSAAPDARTLRYYQTLGILDRPVRYDGRDAIYGYRHLLQAVATKLLQAHGYSLSQVQSALVGRTSEQLEAAVREALGAATAAAPPPTAPPAPSTRTLATHVVAPGILVTIDPDLVPDPDAVVARIRRVLHTSVPGGSV